MVSIYVQIYEKITIYSLSAFLLVYTLVIFLTLVILINNNVIKTDKSISIYILSNGVHTNVMVRLKNENESCKKS
jgi:hypothetical protein